MIGIIPHSYEISLSNISLLHTVGMIACNKDNALEINEEKIQSKRLCKSFGTTESHKTDIQENLVPFILKAQRHSAGTGRTALAEIGVGLPRIMEGWPGG